VKVNLGVCTTHDSLTALDVCIVPQGADGRGSTRSDAQGGPVQHSLPRQHSAATGAGEPHQHSHAQRATAAADELNLTHPPQPPLHSTQVQAAAAFYSAAQHSMSLQESHVLEHSRPGQVGHLPQDSYPSWLSSQVQDSLLHTSHLQQLNYPLHQHSHHQQQQHHPQYSLPFPEQMHQLQPRNTPLQLNQLHNQSLFDRLHTFQHSHLQPDVIPTVHRHSHRPQDGWLAGRYGWQNSNYQDAATGRGPQASHTK
jgi:hypothetical protein